MLFRNREIQHIYLFYLKVNYNKSQVLIHNDSYNTFKPNFTEVLRNIFLLL